MRWLLVIALLTCATVAHAGPHQVLVLRAEGNADTASRTSVDTHVLRLAKHLDGKIDAGDITLSDAATAAGCTVTEASCDDEILTTFGVDEMVATTVTSAGGQLHVTVRRLARDSQPRTATATIPRGLAPEVVLDANVGPLFGAKLATAPVADNAATTTAATESAPAASQSEPSATAPLAEPDTATAEPPAPAPASIAQDDPPPDRRIQKFGMTAGGVFALIGVVLWAQAASIQGDIDSASVDTPADFVRLQALERDADRKAGLGNLLFLGGVAVGSISAYFYWRKGRRARTQTARIMPTVFPHGAGLVLSFGRGR